MNIYSRLLLLSMYFNYKNLDEFEKDILYFHKKSNMRPAATTVRNYFQTNKNKKEGEVVKKVNNSGAQYECSQDFADLIEKFCSYKMESADYLKLNKISLNDKLSEFVTGLNMPLSDIKEVMNVEAKELVEIFSGTLIGDKKFLPGKIILKGADLHRIYDKFVSVYSLYRYRGERTESVIVEESIVLNFSEAPMIYYKDHQNFEYNGMAIISDEKIVGILICKDANLKNMQIVNFIMFTDPIYNRDKVHNEYMISISRSRRTGSVHHYRAVARREDVDFQQRGELPDNSLEKIKYDCIINNGSTIFSSGEDSSFAINLSILRNRYEERGVVYSKVYDKIYNKDFSFDEIVEKIESFLKDERIFPTD